MLKKDIRPGLSGLTDLLFLANYLIVFQSLCKTDILSCFSAKRCFFLFCFLLFLNISERIVMLAERMTVLCALLTES